MKRNKIKFIIENSSPMDLVKTFTKRGLINFAYKRGVVPKGFWGSFTRLRKLDIAKMILEVE